MLLKILKKNDVPYRVEVSFPDLYGVGNTNLLKYDFPVLNKDGTIKCLISKRKVKSTAFQAVKL